MFCLFIVKMLFLEKFGEKVLYILLDIYDQYKLWFYIIEDVVFYNLFFKKLNKILMINFIVIKNIIKI